MTVNSKNFENEENKAHSVIGVSIDNSLIGFILLGHLLREDSINSIKQLRNDTYKINILSGDRKDTEGVSKTIR